MLGTLPDLQKTNLKDYVAPLVHAYNAKIHGSTGFSPFYLMFGREPRLPVDVEFGVTPHTACSGRFVDNLRHAEAQKHSRLAADRNKRYYDVKKSEAQQEQRDRFLVRNCTPAGKLDNKWEQHV
ncbi:uncharacterized protein LOC110252963, partial [Exaiptasia diaphana]|uniref:Integrase catalytic domain-containing protein n=1 Tax=Exaiptasia diaphana TaxID=2652724 RepID=A0A913Y6A4_EXADI